MPLGNWGDTVFDYRNVGCEAFRELLSARLDGEATPAENAVAESHLAACGECRRWLERATTVTRLVRFGPASAGPDVVGSVLPAAPGPGRAALATALRLLLGALGTAQLVLGVVQALNVATADQGDHTGAMVGGVTAGHLWHESSAWNVAVGAGFLWVAARRAGPGGIVPILTAFVAGLALLSVADIAAGRVDAARLATHGFVVAGYLVVLALSRPSLSVDRPPGGRRAAGTGPGPASEPSGGWNTAGYRDAA